MNGSQPKYKNNIEAVLFLDNLIASDDCLDYGIIVLEINDILHYQDCFGWKKAEDLESKVMDSLLSHVNHNKGTVINHHRFEFLVVVPNSSNAKQLAQSVLSDITDLNIDIVDNEYLKQYEMAPKGKISLTASVLLLDKRIQRSNNESFINNALALHEISHSHRRGMVTTLDLTENVNA